MFTFCIKHKLICDESKLPKSFSQMMFSENIQSCGKYNHKLGYWEFGT